MKYLAPKKLIDILCRYLVEEYLPFRKAQHKQAATFNKKDIRFFAKGAGELSFALTQERHSLPKNYLNKKEYRAGYLLYFTITNYLKALFCLNEIGTRGGFASSMKILDIGSGPGTSILAACDYFAPKNISLEIVAVDQNKNILKDAGNIFHKYCGRRERLYTVCSEISSRSIGRIAEGKKFDLVFASNFLSEIRDFDERLRLIETVFNKHLSAKGIIVIIEPALRETTRDLMKLRDALTLQNTGVGILSPCLHENMCPMLAINRRDWCHIYLDWERPSIIEKVDRLIDNRTSYLKFSYFIIGRKNNLLKTLSESVFRIVSAPLRSNGKTEILICNKKGLARLTRLDKDRSNTNGVFDTLKRGDIIEYAGPLKLAKDSKIKKVNG